MLQVSEAMSHFQYEATSPLQTKPVAKPLPSQVIDLIISHVVCITTEWAMHSNMCNFAYDSSGSMRYPWQSKN